MGDELERLRTVADTAVTLVRAARKVYVSDELDAAWRAVTLALNATGTGYLGDISRSTNTPERVAELLVANERLTARLDRALRACHAVTYGDGGVTECAIVVDELENSKRLDEMREDESNDQR